MLSPKQGKDMLTVVVGKLAKKHGKESGSSFGDEEAGEGFDDGYTSAAESIISAVKGGDASSLASALKDFFDMCKHEKSEEEEEEY